MVNYKKSLVAVSLALAAATLTSIASTSSAFAQCADCSVYQDRDPFTEGLRTAPANQPPAAVAPRAANPGAPNNANAEMRNRRSRTVGKSDGQPR